MMTGERDEQWEGLQARIEKFVGQLSRIDVKRIEYKPQFAVPLLDMPSEHNKQSSPIIKRRT